MQIYSKISFDHSTQFSRFHSTQKAKQSRTKKKLVDKVFVSTIFFFFLQCLRIYQIFLISTGRWQMVYTYIFEEKCPYSTNFPSQANCQSHLSKDTTHREFDILFSPLFGQRRVIMYGISQEKKKHYHRYVERNEIIVKHTMAFGCSIFQLRYVNCGSMCRMQQRRWDWPDCSLHQNQQAPSQSRIWSSKWVCAESTRPVITFGLCVVHHSPSIQSNTKIEFNMPNRIDIKI